MEDQTQKKSVKLPTKVTLTIRVLVGGYLLYTAYSLREAIQTSVGREHIFFLLFTVLFVLCGVFLVLHSGRELLRGRYVGGALDETEEAEEETADEGKEE